MAYDARDIVQYAQGPVIAVAGNRGSIRTSMYHYTTPDTHANLLAADYFNPAARMLSRGDIITATVVNAGVMQLRNYMVSSNDGTVVVVVQQIFTA